MRKGAFVPSGSRSARESLLVNIKPARRVFKGSLNARFAAIYLAGELFADPSSDTYPQDDLLIPPFFRNRATSSSKGDLSLGRSIFSRKEAAKKEKGTQS